MSSTPVPPNQPPQCGPSIATPAHGHGAFTVSCSSVIAAPPLACLETVLKTGDYPQWNTFCPNVTIDAAPPVAEAGLDSIPEVAALASRESHLYPGVDFQFEVIMKPGGGSRQTLLHVSLLEAIERDGKKGYRIAWTMRGAPHYVLRAERVQEFVASEDGRSTEYCCYETFGGAVAYPMRYLVGSQVAEGFGRWQDGLQTWTEGRQGVHQ
ncbi:hypothetical protein F5X68DRAFT_198179 [Plectosphaerella plurivora]|uniref:Polyketide cyclase/dehydrase n=1 Tax=Plectosphaerella plurivora TaxID=936078 RepID=A0A9P8VLM1_9PEZI|nr:hypothetical protein F5X68DRAFT_198179 [Plectosphaerella plurivora]